LSDSQAEDKRLATWALDIDSTKADLAESKRKLKEDLSVALETKDANDNAGRELQDRERQLEDHEAELHKWRAAMKADVAKQVSEQELMLQVCLSQASSMLGGDAECHG
jgi:hypothetical protein